MRHLKLALVKLEVVALPYNLLFVIPVLYFLLCVLVSRSHDAGWLFRVFGKFFNH